MNSTKKDIFTTIPDNITFESNLLNSSSIDDIYKLRGIDERRIFIDEDIDQYVVTNVVRTLLEYNRMDKYFKVEDRMPVIIYLNSNGGDVDAGFELIDVIQNSKTPVYIVNLGYCYSMGFLIYLAGHKRYGAKNATFLIHDGSSFVSNSTNKARDTMEFVSKLEDRVRDSLLLRTKITPEEYESKQRHEWYMFCDEAKKYGIVDYIIGEDVELDEVV